MVFDDQIYYFNGQAYFSEESHLLFMIELSRYFRKAVFCSRVKSGSMVLPYTVPSEIEVFALPYYRDVPSLCLKLPVLGRKLVRLLSRCVDQMDVLVLSWPHPISLILLYLVRRSMSKKVVALLVRQNMRELVRLRYRGFRKLVATLFVRLLEWQLSLLGRRCLIFVVDERIRAKMRPVFPNVYSVALPVISSKHIDPRENPEEHKTRETLRLLFVGRLEPEKGLTVLLEAVALLKKYRSNFHLDIVGSGQDLRQLTKLIEQMDIGGNLSLWGYLPFGDMLFKRYRQADIFVLPSLSEGTPNVLVEAMAFGLPIVASNVGGCQRLVHDRRNGLLVKPRDAEALSNALLELLDDEGLRTQLGLQARRDVHPWLLEEQQAFMLTCIGQHFEREGMVYL